MVSCLLCALCMHAVKSITEFSYYNYFFLFFINFVLSLRCIPFIFFFPWSLFPTISTSLQHRLIIISYCISFSFFFLFKFHFLFLFCFTHTQIAFIHKIRQRKKEMVRGPYIHISYTTYSDFPIFIHSFIQKILINVYYILFSVLPCCLWFL